MYNDVLQLVTETETTDQYGDTVITTTLKEVFCEVKSIGQTEFYQAQTNSLKPELKFVLSDYLDYDGQAKIIYDGFIYNVLRTYRSGIELEITVYGGVRYVSSA